MKITSLLITFFIVVTILGSKSVSVQAVTELTSDYSVRLINYEKNFPSNLTEEESGFIKSNCANIKNNIIKTRDRIDLTTIAREKIYGEIEQKLSAIQSRITRQSLDTSVIDLMLASYRIEVSNYKNTAEGYSVILSDIATIDCENNPSLFKSAIGAARKARNDTVNYISKVKEVYVSQIISGFELLNNQLYER